MSVSEGRGRGLESSKLTSLMFFGSLSRIPRNLCRRLLGRVSLMGELEKQEGRTSSIRIELNQTSTSRSTDRFLSCSNLATIADGLGMDQDVAGVTLLALGNGSPDVSSCRRQELKVELIAPRLLPSQVFSTYAAFTASSGSLAIGELLGAATWAHLVPSR